MEALRINGQRPSITFTGLVPESEYTLEYIDLSNDQSYTTTEDADVNGNVTFILDEYVSYDAVLDASVYDYMEEVVITTNIDVIRPYTDIYSLSTDLNKTTAQVKEMERIARYIIDSEVSEGFGYTRKEKEIV